MRRSNRERMDDGRLPMWAKVTIGFLAVATLGVFFETWNFYYALIGAVLIWGTHRFASRPRHTGANRRWNAFD